VRISDQQAEQYRKRGHLIVPGFLAGDELAAARENFSQYFPSAQELTATPQRYGAIYDDPEHLQVEFPFAGDALNHISTHPDMIFSRRQRSGRNMPEPATSIRDCIWIIKGTRWSSRAMMATSGRST
jgi:hypothetical protein